MIAIALIVSLGVQMMVPQKPPKLNAVSYYEDSYYVKHERPPKQN